MNNVVLYFTNVTVFSMQEQLIAMGTFFVTILGPSGWILSHLENYKNRPVADQE